ncbi:hypothetical protein [Halanaerobacter jeridensis]|uniref:YceG-like family protein n=1 Tax=Halanaerobacter jeridensis TaxID=706427 RepID=A0A939BNJ9_9FIRM|nr:hypothetical protein [Halanaerobacter jeridensis]MBM7555368.1 hypothetical protein [Halanaerobacter jeridensis]
MLRNVLLGIGITLIIISSILMVTDLTIGNEQTSIKSNKLSRQEIITEARKFGMSFAGQEYYNKHQQDLSLNQTTTLSLPEATSSSLSTPTSISINIPSGISSREVADLLLKKKLIKNKKSFIQLLTKFDLENKIMAGRYKFTADVSPLTVLLSLTGK